MENQREPLQPAGEVQPESPVFRVGNGPIRDYRTMNRPPGQARRMRHGTEALYCVPMTKCMIIMSIIFTGMIIIFLIVLLVNELSTRFEIEFTPRTTDTPKYY